MKRLVSFTILLIALLNIVPAFAQEDLDATLEWTPYGLTIDYPEDWVTLYSFESNYYVFGEEVDDVNSPSFDPQGQLFIVWVIDGARIDGFGNSPENIIENYASANIDGFRERDIEEIETDSGIEMFITSGDIVDGEFMIIATTEGPDDTLFLFLGISPSRDSDDLEDNVSAMLDTLELEVPEDIFESGRADEATPIEYGDVVEGEITTSQAGEEYIFEGDEGDIVSIAMIATSNSDDLDPYIILVDERGRQLAVNDDINTAGANYNSQISGFVLPQDGLYIVVATRFQQEAGNSTGEFEMSLNLRILDDGEEVLFEEGEITDRRSSEEYEFEANAGDLVTITMVDTSRDDALDPMVRLLDSDGNELTSNDDAQDTSVGSLNSQIFAYELPDSGTYTVVATRYLEDEGNGEGEYELSVVIYASVEVEPNQQGNGNDQDSELEYGDTVQSVIDAEHFEQLFTFDGSEGDIVTITMVDISADDALDPLLILLDPNGTEATRNDDGDTAIVGQFNSQILNFTLPADGTYTIIATRFSQEAGNTIGEFELSVVEGEVSSEGK